MNPTYFDPIASTHRLFRYIVGLVGGTVLLISVVAIAANPETPLGNFTRRVWNVAMVVASPTPTATQTATPTATATRTPTSTPTPVPTETPIPPTAIAIPQPTARLVRVGETSRRVARPDSGMGYPETPVAPVDVAAPPVLEIAVIAAAVVSLGMILVAGLKLIDLVLAYKREHGRQQTELEYWRGRSERLDQRVRDLRQVAQRQR